jgi:GNAT superfamily N-acetyltransferase
MPSSSIPPRVSACSIQTVPSEAIDEYITFINDARSQTFPGRSLAPDNASLLRDGACFLEARDGKELVAAIGFVPYNHRFPQFKYHDVRTVEVVRLYVEPRYRRCGLGTALFKKLYEKAKEAGVGRFYMHTHPFLPGAIAFWQKRGFEIIEREEDPVWQTTHMRMMLDDECSI